MTTSNQKVNTMYYGGMSCYSLPDTMTEKEARSWARKYFNVAKLPNGTCFDLVGWHNHAATKQSLVEFGD